MSYLPAPQDVGDALQGMGLAASDRQWTVLTALDTEPEVLLADDGDNVVLSALAVHLVYRVLSSKRRVLILYPGGERGQKIAGDLMRMLTDMVFNRWPILARTARKLDGWRAIRLNDDPNIELRAVKATPRAVMPLRDPDSQIVVMLDGFNSDTAYIEAERIIGDTQTLVRLH